MELITFARILTHGNPLFLLTGALLSYVMTLLFLFLFYRQRYTHMLRYGDNRIFLEFCSIPFLYYLYGYLSSGYNFMQSTNLDHFIVRILPGLIVFVTYLLLPDIFKNIYEKQLWENNRQLILAQLSAATNQIDLLRETERQSAIYRHDLRHHMNYLRSCLSEDRLQEAADYIDQTFEKLDSIKGIRYCDNESVNLILASCAAKARNKSITISFQVSPADYSRFQIIDLCSLLSNALENALHACEQIEDTDKRSITLSLYEKNTKLCLNLCNSYAVPPAFENGIPTAFREGHGFGLKSMVYVIEKYHGIYRFSAKDGEFTFQMSM